MRSKSKSYDIAVIINIDGKMHQVILSKEENDALLATIQLMHRGCIKVLDEVISGIALVNALKKKVKATKK